MRRHRRGNLSTAPRADIIAVMACLLVICAAALAAFVFLPRALSLQAAASAVDCPAATAAGTTIILIDASDPFSDNERRAIGNQIRLAIAGARLGEKVSIYEVGADGLSPLAISRCRPKTRAEADPLFENPIFIGDEYARTYERPLLNAAETIVGRETPLAASPILEAIADLSAEEELTVVRGARTVMIFSDFLQHSDHLNQYGADAGFEAFAERDHSGIAAPRLDGVNVVLSQVMRDRPKGGERQTERHDAFWRDYFKSAGASLTVNRIR